jgi:hypothetical protein
LNAPKVLAFPASVCPVHASDHMKDLIMLH